MKVSPNCFSIRIKIVYYSKIIGKICKHIYIQVIDVKGLSQYLCIMLLIYEFYECYELLLKNY